MNYSIGTKIKYSRSFTEEDVRDFARLSGDDNPLHLDKDFARTSIFKERVVHGILTISIFSKIFGTIYPATGGIYLSQDCKFFKPVFLNEEITGEVELVEFDSERSIGTFITNCYNAEKQLVVTGKAKIKLP